MLLTMSTTEQRLPTLTERSDVFEAKVTRPIPGRTYRTGERVFIQRIVYTQVDPAYTSPKQGDVEYSGLTANGTPFNLHGDLAAKTHLAAERTPDGALAPVDTVAYERAQGYRRAILGR